MRQTARVHFPTLGFNAVGQIAAFDKAGAKVRLIHFAASCNEVLGLRFIARDSSRRYEFVVSATGVMFNYWIDQKGDLRTAIELQGNIVFEIVNYQSAVVVSEVEASILYDITYDNQKP